MWMLGVIFGAPTQGPGTNNTAPGLLQGVVARCGSRAAITCNAYVRDILHLAQDMGGKIYAERESDGRSMHTRASNVELPARSQVGVDEDRHDLCRRA